MPDLATIADLEATLGRSLTAAEAAKAPALLASASAKIRGYCKRQFTETAAAELVLRPIGTTLRLPGKPVTAVIQVEQIGTAGTADRVMGVTEWAFDGIDMIDVWPWPCGDGGINDGVVASGSYANTYRVVYDNGETPVPKFIIDKCVELVLRPLLAPTPIANLVSERIGQYQYQYGQFPGGQSPGPTVTMTEADERDLVKAGYRRTAGTIQLRV